MRRHDAVRRTDTNNENIGFGGHNHQQDPILVCGPDIEGNVNDPDSPLGSEVRDLCMQVCEARPIDTTAMPPNLEDWTGLNGEDYVLAYTACDVGPGVDRIVDAVHGGNGVLCESIQGVPTAYPGAAGIGECTNENENTDCPIEELESCEDWRPDKWVFSTTDRVGNVKSVIHDDFLHNEVNLSAMFACDAHAYVYSSDGTGVAFIDEPDADDFLHRLWLREGYNDFSIRADKNPGWTPWYSLNTFAEITDALQHVPDDADRYELRYDDGTGTQVTRRIEIKDCTALGDTKRCDATDLAP